ncbi:MAG: hypothetical protein KDA55_16950, partial [Planctomycetales bacterium]|nr:hypothetical protein [Planctomycetales bacterium]
LPVLMLAAESSYLRTLISRGWPLIVTSGISGIGSRSCLMGHQFRLANILAAAVADDNLQGRAIVGHAWRTSTQYEEKRRPQVEMAH